MKTVTLFYMKDKGNQTASPHMAKESIMYINHK